MGMLLVACAALLLACAATSTSAKPASSSSSSILVFLFLLITASPKVARRALASLRSFSRFDFREVRVARGPAQREGYECFLDGHCINTILPPSLQFCVTNLGC